MSRLVKIVLAVAVLGVAAFAGIYFLFFNEDAPPEFELTQSDEQSDAGTASDIGGTWTVAEGSEAGYRVREKLANLPAQSDAVGRTADVTGAVVIDGTSASAASFEVDLATLTSDEDRRDNRVREALQTDQFPTATFELTSPIDLDASATSARVEAAGDLTIHGVTKSVTIPIEAARDGEQLELVGSITFPMADYGITPPSIGGFVSVEPDATLEFRILLERDKA